MLEIGTMKEYQVQEVILVQKAGDNRLFGKIALELGYTNDNAIKRYVDYLSKPKKWLDPEIRDFSC